MSRDGRYPENAGAFRRECPGMDGILRMQEHFEGYVQGWYPKKTGASRSKYLKKNNILVFPSIKT